MGTAPILSCRRKRDDRGFWCNLPRQMEGFPWIFGIYLTHPLVAESQEEAFGVRRAKTGPRWLVGKLSVCLPRWRGPIRFVTANVACLLPVRWSCLHSLVTLLNPKPLFWLWQSENGAVKPCPPSHVLNKAAGLLINHNCRSYNPLENQSLDCIWYSNQFCIDCGSSQRNGRTVYVEHFTFALSFHLLNRLLFTLLQLWLHHTRT